MVEPSVSLPTRWSRREALGAIGAGAVALGLSGVSASAPVRTRFGVNAAWLFLGELAPNGGSGSLALASLGKRGIPFVRFAASAHFARDWARYEAEPKAHWARLDRLFAAAEHNGVALVPSLLWHTVALAFHCREPMQAWADPKSRTRTMARTYVETFVERYDRSPALLMYEFANELNTWVDLPNVLSFWPKPDQTMPARRPVEGDRLTGVQLRGFVRDFALWIRSRNSRKPIGMGSDLPRQNAWHLARGKWDVDTPAQFIEQFRSITPPELDVLSAHIYEGRYGERGSIFATLPDLLAAMAKTAALDGRRTFIGEFGVPRLPDRAEERRRFAAMMDAVRGAGIDYAALWNFAPATFQPEWDVSLTNDRAYQIDALVEANKAP